jgi:importin subunit alpha-6/7
LPAIADGLESEEFLTMLESLISIRRLLTFLRPPTMAAIELGVHVRLIELSSHESAQVRLEAWWSLANLAVGSSGECGHLVKKGAIPCFLRSLKDKDPMVAEQGAWGLGNLCVDSIAFRNMILEEGGLHILLSAVNELGHPRLLKVAIWAVANLCRGKPKPQYKLIEEGILFMCSLIVSRCLTD